jgi:anaerobic ribonucleoside-triphosphate reductase activating protein
MLDLIPKRLVGCEVVWSEILEAKRLHQIEGVTFLGGEPLLQAKGLAEVALDCQSIGLSVMVFTGYTLEELREAHLPGACKLLAHTDILVDGPYVHALREPERNWAGSWNQRIRVLSTRYEPGIEYASEYRPSVEFRVRRGDWLRVNGHPVTVKFRDLRRLP